MSVKVDPRLEEFAENYPGSIKNKVLAAINGHKNKIIFNGPSGVGKNYLVSALAKSIGASVEFINLYSVDRIDNQDVSSLILSNITNAAKSQSLFGGGPKILYIEDVEKILSVDPNILKKLGGISNTIIVFESSSGEIFKSKNKRFLTGYEVIRFYKLNESVIRAQLGRISDRNGLKISQKLIDSIAKNSRGNLKSAVTDLETAALMDGKDIDLYPRDKEDTVFEYLNSIFLGRLDGVDIQFSSDADAKLFEIWLAEKSPQVFTGERLFQAADRIAFADVLLNKIKKQNWGLLKFVKAELLYGVSSLADGRPVRIDYSAPKWDCYYRF